MERHDLIRKIFQAAYCMSYTRFCQFYEQDNHYTKEKWVKFQRNFSGWYCDLDSENSKRFIKFCLGE